MKILTILFITSFVNFSENYRILGLFPLPSRSHMIVFERLMKTLVQKGHEVDVLSHFPQQKPIPGYNDISLKGIIPIYDYTVTEIRSKLSNRYNLMEYILYSAGVQLCKTIFNSTVATDLKNAKTKYDLIITEIFSNDCMLGFGYHFSAPVVSIITSVSIPWSTNRIGQPDNPSYIPNYVLPYLSKMNFIERLINTATLIATNIGFSFARDSTDATANSFFGANLPNLRELTYNTSLILVNSHFTIDYVRPTLSNFIEVGGLHMKQPEELSKNIQELLNIENEYKGVIYLSMGSMILTETLPLQKLNAFFDTFRELPYKILWRAVRENMPKDLDIPENVQFEPWMPQADILCHPNVKLFITHGGLMGVQESVYCSVPVFGIPFFGDHEYSLKRAVNAGYGSMIYYEEITKEKLSKAINEVLENSKYKTNAERVSKLFKDHPSSAMDVAIYWIEYVARHHGASHLRSVGAELPWYQYYLLDVGATLLLFIILILITISYVLRFIVQKILYYFK